MKRIENRRLYIQLVIGVILLGMLGVISNHYLQRIGIEQRTLLQVPNYEKRFNDYAQSEANKIASYLELLKEKQALQSAYLKNDRNALYKAAQPIFEHLNANGDITHFYFIKPDGEVLLRVHDQYRYCDIVDRYTFLKAKETLAPFHGLEFGLKKNYTLRVVHPWIVDGKLIGFIELGKEVDKVIDTLSDELDIEIFFAVNKSVFDNVPQFVNERLHHSYQMEHQYIVYQTAEIPDNMNWLMSGTNEFNWVQIREEVFISHKNVLKDVSGSKLGEILYLVNITKDYNTFMTTIWRYGIIMGVGTFLMLTIGFMFAKQSQNKINTTMERLEKAKEETEALNLEQKSLLSLFDIGDSVLFKWHNDDAWSVAHVSSNVSRLLGYSVSDFKSARIAYVKCIHQDDINHVAEEVRYAMEHNLDFFKHDAYRIVTQSGEIKWVNDYTVTQKDELGAIEYFIGYIMDITEQKEQEHKSREKLQQLIDMQNSIVLLTDGKTLKFTNKTFLDFFGYKDMAHFKEDYRCVCDRFIEHDNFFHLGKQQPGEAHWIVSLLNLSGRQRVVSMINKDAVPHAFSVSINLFDTNDYVVNFTDISDTMVEKLELTKEATVDVLTGVYNRIYFNKHIKEILEAHHNKAMQTGVIFFDIDHFKKVNDTFGHDVGDMVLKTVALLATRHTRDDDKVIRWGGEEFIIICEIDAVKSLYKIAEHLRSVVEHHAFKEVGSVTCSFGCAAHDSNDKIMNTLKKADEKLYEAKNNGRNRVECV